jgi:chemotaxis methyl-accepting protein methylase/chemotaxis response regulator CheB/signal transduction histidine kinase
MPTDLAPSKKSFPIVGIGASAGGLEAFTQLIKSLPVDTGMAFVLIQHLAPQHKSLLADILSRQTQMPVSEVKDKTLVEQNHIYVIPPNTQMTIQSGVLMLTERTDANGPFHPIDYFLRSLAADQGSGAIAVILSGADGDGSQAMEAIKSEGGITFAQDFASAKINSMPAHAAATGLVDFILPPEAIACELARIAQDPTAVQMRNVPGEDLLTTENEALASIYAQLQQAQGVDFTYYKQATLKRRIARRMVVKKANSLKDYVQVLKREPEEVSALYNDVLIHVTEFFRDPGTFDNLKTIVFPLLMKDRASTDSIRIWVPGCATGEEVYSIGICLFEFLSNQSTQNPIQIFATDISDKPLKIARAAVYTERALRGVSVERMRKFFTPVSGGYQVNKSLQDLCVFAKQNVAKDPPFSRMDLISCRNVLIYLGPELQKRVMPIFNYALKPTGLLVLGNSETLGSFSDLFTPLDRTSKIYRKKIVPIGRHPLFTKADYPIPSPGPKMSPPSDDGNGHLSIQKEADRYVIEKYSPAAVIIDASMNIVEFRGAVNQFLEVTSGAATLNLLKLAKEGLLSELRPAIHKAKNENIAVKSKESQIRRDGVFRNVTIEVIPLKRTPAQEPYFMVLFEEVAATPISESKTPTLVPKSSSGLHDYKAAWEASEIENAGLSKELMATKNYLQSTINDQEIVNEELKAANEEAISTNEEFQSANEELQTAKEELQSTNEETVTLNDELQNRNLELTRLNDDLVNLMGGANVPIIILGRDHHIRRLTPAAEKLLNIVRLDTGRSIHELTLAISIPNLGAMVTSVLTSLLVEQCELQDPHGHWYNMRIQLYKTIDDKIDGVVISFSDIQMAKERQAAAKVWSTELEAQVKQRTEELTHTQNALHKAEKLEAIGRLAGGVAHDFNNLMTGILGITEDLLLKVGPQSAYLEDLDHILGAAKRAAVITKQLLAFGRRQVSNPEVLNLNHVIGTMDGLFRRLLGEDIEVKTVLDPQLWPMRINPGNLEQVILNLGLNARDAMLAGGRLTLETANVQCGESHVAQNDTIQPGSYVVLTVADTGTGMAPEIIDHMFEPFFTTKVGNGTGLGLANVYGIVKQADGEIRVESELGKGTTFRIYFPRVEEISPSAPRSSEPGEARGGSETILLAEDEDIVRLVAVKALRKKGYTVLQANNGHAAIEMSENYSGTIDLLVTDIIMPGINGNQLAKSLAAKRGKMGVLFMSGYSQDIISKRGVLKPGTNFIEKTFAGEGLCHKVREVLDAAKKPLNQ